jgi:YD repeat-containing protein
VLSVRGLVLVFLLAACAHQAAAPAAPAPPTSPAPTSQPWPEDPSSWRPRTIAVSGDDNVRAFDAIVQLDQAGRVAALIDADGSTVWAFTYDDAGRLVSATDADAATTRYTYDDAGRLVVERAGDSVVGIRYQEDGLPAEVTRHGKTSAFAYTRDPAGRILTVRLDGSLLAEVGYDAAGRVATVTTDPRTVIYRYRADGTLEAADSGDGPDQSHADYDEQGRLTSAGGIWIGVCTLPPWSARVEPLCLVGISNGSIVVTY